MRSVFVFLIDASKSEVKDFLDLMFIANPKVSTGVDWLIASETGDPVLYIGFYNYDDIKEDWEDLSTILDFQPSLCVYADVSGRHPGTEEVFEFVEKILAKFNGVALDDYTDHCWTLEEIKQRLKVQDHPFFDYLGWYR